jgi:hypothetical protein
MKVRAVEPDIAIGALLSGAQFVDAFRITVDGSALDARRAAEKMMARGPRWVGTLMNLRNRIVAPFGLKTPRPAEAASADSIGIFPIVSQTADRLVAGFNDHHLDFRVVVDVATSGGGQQVTATTLVLRHNLFGRTYLSVILPFHRLITRTMMRQTAS